MNGSGPTNDAHGDEQSLLGTELNTQISYNAMASSSSSSTSEVISRTAASDEEEKGGEIISNNSNNKPWPATFELSSEILAKPIVGRELVTKTTELMHILSPTKLQKSVSI